MRHKADGSEPTASLPLNWGTYRGRHLAGLALIVSGAVCLQGADPFTLQLLLMGSVAHALGWVILPADGWRRAAAVAPSLGVVWLLLTGPQSLWLLTFAFLCWLLVRARPLRSYVTALFVAANGVLVMQSYREYADMPLALGISTAVLVGSAWVARLIAHGVPSPANWRAASDKMDSSPRLNPRR